MAAVRHQEIIIYEEDDVTPIVGSPLCSTDPASARPYLMRVLEMAGSEVDFLNGTSIIGQVSIEILDKRTVSTDQSTGWFTALLADGSGNQQLTGHRIVLRQQDAAGIYYPVFDGVIGDFSLNSDYVTYKLECRDIRERERKTRLFVKNVSGMSLLPRGFGSNYGEINPGAYSSTNWRYMREAEEGLVATFYLEPGTGGQAGVALFNSYRAKDDRAWWNFYNEALAYVPDYDDTDGDFYNNAIVKRVRVQWRDLVGGGAWTDLLDMPQIRTSVWTNLGTAFQPTISINNGTYRIGSQYTRTGIALTGSSLPTNGQTISLRVLWETQPTEENPLYIEKTFGQLLKDIYDGVYSEPGTLPIRYNAAAMANLVTNTPIARCKITEPVENMREWTEEHIYKPLGMVPFINTSGEIEPIKYTLPAAGVTIPQIDDAVIVEGGASWVHDSSNIVTKVDFKYKQDILVRIDPDRPRTQNNVEFVERDVEYVSRFVSADFLGDHTITYAPETLRTLVDASVSNTDPGIVYDDMGALLARLRAREAFDRFGYGAQRAEVQVLRSDPTVSLLTPGSWVVLASSWMPDFESGTRGINRIFQVAGVTDLDPATRKLTLVDGGKNLAPVAQPSISSVVYTTATKTVDVTFTVNAGVDTRIDYAIAPSQPATNSGVWIYAGRRDTAGTISLPPVQAGVTVWVRVRGEAVGRRASAWTNPSSVAISANPTILALDGQLLDGESPKAIWTANSDTQAVRIKYAVYDIDSAIPTSLTTLGDFDVDDLEVVMSSIRVNQYQRILIEAEGFSVWTGAAASGVAGGKMQTTAQRLSEGYIHPQVTVVKSQTSTVGTVDLNVTYDPQYRVVALRYRTRIGNGGSWSAYTEDTVAPYGANVNLTLGETSSIQYEVKAVDQNGVQIVLDGDTIDFQGTSASALVAKIETVASDSTSVTVRVYVADPVPAADISIAYASSALIGGVTPASPQTLVVASVTADLATTGYVQFVITRPVGSNFGRVVFTATSTSRQPVTDAVDVQGPAGPTGPAGVMGIPGPSGIQGATGVAGSNGTTGATGVAGIMGIPGPSGIQGATGATGVAGSNGTTGATGVAGAQGVTGVTGVTGAAGVTGATGVAGAQGDASGLHFTFSTTTTSSDPGSGIVRFNNATLGSVTEIYVDDLDRFGTSARSLIQEFDDSTSVVKGYLQMQTNVNGTIRRVVFRVNSITNQTGYMQLNVTVSVGGSLFTNAENVVMTFWRTGDAGAVGPTGVTGPVGVTGATGVAGVMGIPGPSGIQGATGVAGPTGVTGATGVAGAVGVTGATGAVGVTGATGAVGVTGVTGVTGPAGPTGVTGPVGVTGATGSAGVMGIPGPSGIQGVTGATGVAGPTGVTGAVGPTGVTGATGAGVTGVTGATGVAGVMGVPGPSGVAGPTGVTGATGAVGATGAAGGLNYAPTPADVAINSTTDVTINTRDVTGVVAGDQIVVEAEFVINNNSAATRVCVFTLDFDAAMDVEFSTGALATSATLMHPFVLRAVLNVRSTSLAYGVFEARGQLAAGIAAGGDTTMLATMLRNMSWGTSVADLTGTVTVAFKVRSANAAATQTLRLIGYRITKVSPT